MVMRRENASLAGYLAVLSILDIRESECSFAAAAVRWLARHGDRPKGCQQQSVERLPRPGHSDQEEQEVEYQFKLWHEFVFLVSVSCFGNFHVTEPAELPHVHSQFSLFSKEERLINASDKLYYWLWWWSWFSFNVSIELESRLVLMMAWFKHISCLGIWL